MEAKTWQDTIMSEKELDQLLTSTGHQAIHPLAIAYTQAEKTWDTAFEAGRQEGIREVVEWIKTKMYLRTNFKEEEQSEFLQIDSTALLDDGVPRLWEFGVDPKEWQAKLKDWGIE